MLDDPSQSLGSAHKKHLVQVLEEVAKQKNILVATMDSEFRDLVSNGLTKAKTEFVFSPWTPAKGPAITQR
jgi:ABC-type lipoprotein export system ATPase subunit